jgi:putative ABC transport system substrate-binding protein
MKRIWIGCFAGTNLKSALRNLKSAILVGAMLFALSYSASAQQPKKVPRIGYPGTGLGTPERLDAFRQGLRELGHVEGKNIVIDFRSADGKLERLPAIAAELVHLKVDIIVSAGSTITRAAKQATATIPIVMTQDSDPVGDGFVASLARPGGNITGLSNYAPELSGKRLELLREVVPNLSRVAVFRNAAVPGNAQMAKEVELAAGAVGVRLQYLDVPTANDIEPAFQAARKGRAEAGLMLVSGSILGGQRRTQIAELAIKSRLPMMYDNQANVEAGGLMSYGVHRTDLDRRAATYVDKILKGAKPADLPVEQPTKFEFIVNLRTAKQIGLTFPPNVLARADRVIR